MQISPIPPMQVTDLQSLSGSAAKTGTAAPSAAGGASFEQMLSGLNESQLSADDMVQKLALGESVDLHDVMLNLEENDVNFRVALAIRDRLVDAYREVMRIQV